MTRIQIGARAQDFELPNQHAEPVSLLNLNGQPVVIWFFSRAFGSN